MSVTKVLRHVPLLKFPVRRTPDGVPIQQFLKPTRQMSESVAVRSTPAFSKDHHPDAINYELRPSQYERASICPREAEIIELGGAMP